MDDPGQVAFRILKVVGSLFIASVGVYFWSVVVVGAPFRIFSRLATAARWATESVAHAPEAGWRLWKGIALVGIVASTTLAFWMHTSYHRSFIEKGRAHAAAQTGGAAAPKPDPLSDFVPEVVWTSPADGPVGFLCFLFFLPIAAMHVPIFRNRFRLMTESEMEGHFGFAAMALGLSLLVHAALFYTPLGGLVYQGLNAITNPGMYVGVLFAVIVVEWGWMVLRKRN